MAGGSTTVKVEGLREVQRRLKALETDTADLKAANAAAAAIVATAAATRAPRRSGKLAASVHGNRAAGRATVLGGGALVPYAGPIHWGWPSRGIEGQPFIQSAAVATEAVWLPAYEHALSTAVDKLG